MNKIRNNIQKQKRCNLFDYERKSKKSNYNQKPLRNDIETPLNCTNKMNKVNLKGQNEVNKYRKTFRSPDGIPEELELAD